MDIYEYLPQPDNKRKEDRYGSGRLLWYNRGLRVLDEKEKNQGKIWFPFVIIWCPVIRSYMS